MEFKKVFVKFIIFRDRLQKDRQVTMNGTNSGNEWQRVVQLVTKNNPWWMKSLSTVFPQKIQNVLCKDYRLEIQIQDSDLLWIFKITFLYLCSLNERNWRFISLTLYASNSSIRQEVFCEKKIVLMNSIHYLEIQYIQKAS